MSTAEFDFFDLAPEPAARYLATLTDAEAVKALKEYLRRNRLKAESMLELITKHLGKRPAYAGALKEFDRVNRVTPTTISTSKSEPIFNPSWMPSLGILFVVCGVLIAAYAFQYNVALPDQDSSTAVVNIDRVSMREMLLWTAGFIFISGWIQLGTGAICSAIKSD